MGALRSLGPGDALRPGLALRSPKPLGTLRSGDALRALGTLRTLRALGTDYCRRRDVNFGRGTVYFDDLFIDDFFNYLRFSFFNDIRFIFFDLMRLFAFNRRTDHYRLFFAVFTIWTTQDIHLL